MSTNKQRLEAAWFGRTAGRPFSDMSDKDLDKLIWEDAGPEGVTGDGMVEPSPARMRDLRKEYRRKGVRDQEKIIQKLEKWNTPDYLENYGRTAGMFNDHITPPSLNWDKVVKDFNEAHNQWYRGLRAYEEVMDFIAKGAKRDGPEYKGVVALAKRGTETAQKLLDQQNAIQDDLYSMQSSMPYADDEGRTAAGMPPVITEDEFDDLDPGTKRQWKGYLTSMTYETWDEEAVEAGDTDDKGWDYQDSHFDSLEEAVDSASHDASWLEWSSSSPGPRDWVVSQDDQDYRSGERTINHLFIERADKVPLSKDEIKYITKALRL